MTPVVIAAMMWLMVSVAFILNALQAPRWLIQVPLGLLAAEFVLTIVAINDAECSGGPCIGSEGLHGWSLTAVELVIPGLAGVFTLYVVAYGLLRHRAATS